jgi:NAD(P)-dependent dehydrogenase (short-subunit alcohol dehydrogenase family)
VATLSTRTWDFKFAVNVRGMFLLTRALVPQFVAHRPEAIVNISSKFGKEGSALRAAYAASKHAVIGFTPSLAPELKPHGVRANAITPVPWQRRSGHGTIRTKIRGCSPSPGKWPR